MKKQYAQNDLIYHINMACIFTKKFRTLDPHPPTVQDFFQKKVYFWGLPLSVLYCSFCHPLSDNIVSDLLQYFNCLFSFSGQIVYWSNVFFSSLVKCIGCAIGCPKKTLFLNFASLFESLVRMGVQRPQKKFQRYRPINDTVRPF